MSGVSGWVLGIVGIIILSILVDLILPSGKTSKFIKGIFGYLIIIVILSPVFSFFSGKNHSINDIFSPSNIALQENFISKINRQFLDKLESQIQLDCKNAGLKFVEVGIEADIFENEVNITQISVNLKNVVIEPNVQHTSIRSAILQIVLDNVKVEKEIIKFYE